jgi:N utilization substance protein A
MKTEFMAAVTQLSSERNLPRQVVLAALEAALASAYKKEVFSPDQDIWVKIDPVANDIRVYARKIVAESVADPQLEISLDEARRLRQDAQIGDTVDVEVTPRAGGRIAAQIARQVVLQRLREAEHHAVYEQFIGKEGEVVTGAVQFVQATQVYVNLGKREAMLPRSEQLPGERYYNGQQLKFYLLEIGQGARGPRVVVSRSHPNLVRRLFELEIPEVHAGVIDIRGVAREAGHRSKVAVSSRQSGVEPVGSCLGPRGIRLQSIINQLNGEKIDVIPWHEDPKAFIGSALSPAQVGNIELDAPEKTATVVVPDRQLSLAIGKGGQNARLAAKLTGWRIDIKSASAAEAERAAAAQELAVEEESPEAQQEELPEAQEESVAGVATVGEEMAGEAAPAEEGIEEEEGEAEGEAGEEDLGVLLSQVAEERTARQPEDNQIRFAEDVFPDRRKAAKPEKTRGKGRRHRNQGEVFKDAYEEE